MGIKIKTWSKSYIANNFSVTFFLHYEEELLLEHYLEQNRAKEKYVILKFSSAGNRPTSNHQYFFPLNLGTPRSFQIGTASHG